MTRFVTTAAALLLAGMLASCAGRLPAAPPRAVAPSVAILDAEYITPDTTAARTELTGRLDNVLAAGAAQQKDITLVDRQRGTGHRSDRGVQQRRRHT